MPTKTIHGVRNVICTCSLGMDICFFTFRMNFELRGWPPQPQTFSNNTKIHTYAISQFIYFMGFYGILRGAVCAGWTLSGRLANKSPAQIANCHATLIAIWRN